MARQRSIADRRSASTRRLTFERLTDRCMMAVLTVDIGAPDCEAGGDALFCQIQDAVEAAENGDRIEVHPGVYEQVAVRTDNLTIESAEGPETVEVRGSDRGRFEDKSVQVYATGVTVRGLSADFGFFVGADCNTLEGNSGQIHVGWLGFFGNLPANFNTIRRNTGQIRLLNASNNLIALNRVNGDTPGNNSGINLFQGDNNLFLRNRIRNVHHGFVLDYGKGNRLRHNVVKDGGNGKGYLFGANSFDNTLHGNIAERAGDTCFGYSGDGVTHDSWRANVAIDCRIGFGLQGHSDTHGIRLVGNISRGGEYGFFLENVHDVALRNNIADGNSIYGYWLYEREPEPLGLNEGNRFVANRSVDSGEYGFRVDVLRDNQFRANTCEGGDNQGGLVCANFTPQ